MKSIDIISSLDQEYPGKTVVTIPEDDPKEIIIEISPSTEHPEFSIAIAFIKKSELHYHSKSVETYFVEKGTLVLHVSDEKHILEEDQSYTVYPGQYHWAEGNFTKVRVKSSPGWTPEDHFLVE